MAVYLQVAEMRVLHLINGVTHKDILQNDDIRAELGVKRME